MKGQIGAKNQCRGGRELLRVLLAFVLVLVAGASARAERFGHVLVVEDDGRILEPAAELPFGGRRIDFLPTADGGYQAHHSSLRWQPRGLGRRLVFPAGSATASRVELDQPVRVFGVPYTTIWVHPNGAIALGEDWQAGAQALATSPGSLLASLVSGPAVVAALWNDLDPQATPARGVFVSRSAGMIVVSWIDVPSARPAAEPNTFRVFLHRDGRIAFEYAKLATRWGIVGLSPGRERAATRIVDLANVATLQPTEATLGWYRDRPRLNTIALARRVLAEAPDRFEFLTVFTDQPVDAPHLVYSTTAANHAVGLGMPVFDHSGLHGSATLEHIVVMNDLEFWADDPRRSPRHRAYAYAPSTHAVLAHEVGHRWEPRLLEEPFQTTPGSGHWNSLLATQASFIGGAAFREEGDGQFRVAASMRRYGYLDRYLMGLIPAEEVPPFFAIEGPSSPARPLAVGTRVEGIRRDLDIEDLVDELGRRSPEAGEAKREFRMAFVLVVPAGATADARDIYKMQRIRRGFAPFFRQASGGSGRMTTGLGPRTAIHPPQIDPALLAGQPLVLGAKFFVGADAELGLDLDWADLDGNLATLEISTDITADLPSTRIDIAPRTHGHRRGTLQFTLASLPSRATRIAITLVDAGGQTSSPRTMLLPF